MERNGKIKRAFKEWEKLVEHFCAEFLYPLLSSNFKLNWSDDTRTTCTSRYFQNNKI